MTLLRDTEESRSSPHTAPSSTPPVPPPALFAMASWNGNQYQLRGTILRHISARKARTIPRATRKIPRSSSPPCFKTPRTRHPSPHQASVLPKPPTFTTLRHARSTTKILLTLINPTQPSAPSLNLSAHQWHLRLDHPHLRKLSLTAARRLLPTRPTELPGDVHLTCSACNHAKLLPSPHKPKFHKYSPGIYVSTDTYGPIKPT